MSKKMLKAEEIVEIRERLQSGQLPWDSDLPDPVYAKVANLVRRCCNNDPRKRPPAMAVKDHLLDILQTPMIQRDVSESNTDDQVLRLLDAVTIENKSPPECQLSNDLIENLKRRARGGDSTAAYLFGSSVWVGIVDPGSDYMHEPIMIVPGSDLDSERRSRAAIEYLELAVRGDNKQATARLYEAYVKLAKLCKKRLKQDKTALGLHDS
ncbi:hypothetical protein IL306_015186 [Fusarium sp. DS 682]|nr:hypothetical protein IL306_015186 [Fusarium sp. DS 682]